MTEGNQSAKQFWNSFAEAYDSSETLFTSLVYRLMLPLVDLQNAESLIEAGCGPGNGLKILKEIVNDSVKILANDFSEKMIEICTQITFPNVEVIQADNESLPYPDCAGERYIANLSLHLVNEPRNMLREAYRVLKPGGIAVFSVWGRNEAFNLFTVMDRGLAKSGVPSSGQKSPFYLNSQKSLNELIAEAGFVNVRSFFTSTGYGIKTAEEMAGICGEFPGVSELKDSDPEKYQIVLENIRAEADLVLRSGQLFTFEALIAVGYKQ